MSRACQVRRLHLVTYENGMAMQETLVTLRQGEAIDDQLLLLQHTPVITQGRGGKRENLLGDQQALERSGVRFYDTTRGGDITYHGPGQLVGYPILHLGEGNRDIRKYVTKVEEVLIRTLRDFGIEAARWEGNRGVWIGREKIAAIGVRISRWVTSHGFALNVDPNLDHFALITPCGIAGTGVTSMAKQLGRTVAIEEVLPVLERHFAEVFDRELTQTAHDLDLVKVVVTDGEKVLLLHRKSSPPFWQPVTGRLEEGETHFAAASRELREESGISGTLIPLDLTQSFVIAPEFIPGAHKPVFTAETAYMVGVDAVTEPQLDQEEHDDWGWFTFQEAYERILWTDDREALQRAERHARMTPQGVRRPQN